MDFDRYYQNLAREDFMEKKRQLLKAKVKLEICRDKYKFKYSDFDKEYYIPIACGTDEGYAFQHVKQGVNPFLISAQIAFPNIKSAVPMAEVLNEIHDAQHRLNRLKEEHGEEFKELELDF